MHILIVINKKNNNFFKIFIFFCLKNKYNYINLIKHQMIGH